MQRTHLNIGAFALHRPGSLAEACKLAAEFGEQGAIMAGGVDLLQDLKSGRAIEHLIYLRSVPELTRIEIDGDVLRIGSCATHDDIARNPVVAEHAPAVAGIWEDIANIRVRVAGTLGGNLLAGNPAYDGLPALIALGATCVFESAQGSRKVVVEEVATKRGEGILSVIEIPANRGRQLSFDRSLKPVVSVAVSAASGAEKDMSPRIGIGCAFPSALGGPLAAVDDASPADAARVYAEALPEPIDDVFASSNYRRRMIAVLVSRQLAALGRA